MGVFLGCFGQRYRASFEFPKYCRNILSRATALQVVFLREFRQSYRARSNILEIFGQRFCASEYS